MSMHRKPQNIRGALASTHKVLIVSKALWGASWAASPVLRGVLTGVALQTPPQHLHKAFHEDDA